MRIPKNSLKVGISVFYAARCVKNQSKIRGLAHVANAHLTPLVPSKCTSEFPRVRMILILTKTPPESRAPVFRSPNYPNGCGPPLLPKFANVSVSNSVGETSSALAMVQNAVSVRSPPSSSEGNVRSNPARRANNSCGNASRYQLGSPRPSATGTGASQHGAVTRSASRD